VFALALATGLPSGPASAQPASQDTSQKDAIKVVFDGRLRFELVPPGDRLHGSTPAEIQRGRIVITAVELRGRDLLFPEQGIDRAALQQQLDESYLVHGPALTIGQIHLLSDELTQFYRDRGLSFAEAVAEPQEIVDGTLVLRVVMGSLAETNVRGNELYSTTQILEEIQPLFGSPILGPEVESAIYRINRKPGLNVFGVFSMGDTLGDIRLNLTTLEESARATRVRVDNHGLDATGEYRLIVSHLENNPFNKSGSLMVSALTASEGGNLYGSIGYRRPFGLYDTWFANAGFSQFDVNGDFESLGLEGDLVSVSGGWTRSHDKQENTLRSYGVSASYKRATVDSDAFAEMLGQDYQYLLLEPEATLGWDSKSATSALRVNITPFVGQILSQNNANLDSTFYGTRMNALAQTDWRTAVTGSTRLRLNGLYSANTVPASERATLTGPTVNRGYSPGLFSGDQSYWATLEQDFLTINPEGNWRAKPFVFVDYSYGRSAEDTASYAAFTSAGAGLELQLGSHVQSGITLGVPLAEDHDERLQFEPQSTTVYGFISATF